MLLHKHIVLNKSKIEFKLYLSIYFVNRYFDSDDDESYNKTKATKNKKFDDDDLDYQPAPGSPSYQAQQKDDEEDDEEDPLEQFMKANNNQAKKDLELMGKKKEKKQEK
jgi:hypothetical protein